MNMEAQCSVRVVKVSLPELDVWEYVEADVVEAPDHLPTGAYEVAFEGRRVKVHKSARGWNSKAGITDQN
jgi:hypothetical protein